MGPGRGSPRRPWARYRPSRRGRSGYERHQGRHACRECGALPALYVELRSVTGLWVVFKAEVADGWYCRPCGLRGFREHTNHSLLAGWWGPSALIANVVFLGRNLEARWAFGRLPATARDEDAGLPLWCRPGPWFAAAFPLAVWALFAAILRT